MTGTQVVDRLSREILISDCLCWIITCALRYSFALRISHWASQMIRGDGINSQMFPTCSASVQSWAWWSIILLPVQSWMQNTLVMSTSQWSTSKVWWRSTYIIINVCNKYIALFLSSYKLLTGNSTDPIYLPPHHSTPTLVKTTAVTKVNMPIWVTGYIPSKSAKPLISLNEGVWDRNECVDLHIWYAHDLPYDGKPFLLWKLLMIDLVSMNMLGMLTVIQYSSCTASIFVDLDVVWAMCSSSRMSTNAR